MLDCGMHMGFNDDVRTDILRLFGLSSSMHIAHLHSEQYSAHTTLLSFRGGFQTSLT